DGPQSNRKCDYTSSITTDHMIPPLEAGPVWEGAPPLDADMDVEAVLQALSGADSVQVQQLGSVLMQGLRSARQRRVDIIAQEMKAVMDERDGSVAMGETKDLSRDLRGETKDLSRDLRERLKICLGTS
ncbi:hypothetical protein KUCAC02_037482, partial [Chaenocephalus aceratus]